MWRVMLVVIACGCDALFHIDPIAPIAPIDSPVVLAPRCAGALQLQRTYTQLVSEVALPQNLSFAMSIENSRVSYQQGLDGPPMSVAFGGTYMYGTPALRPDGGELFFVQSDLCGNVAIASATGSGTTWTIASTLPFGSGTYPDTPASLDDGLHMFVSNGAVVIEWRRDAAGKWADIGAFDPAPFTASPHHPNYPSLTPDGLLLVFVQPGLASSDPAAGVWLAERASPTAPFSTAHQLVAQTGTEVFATPYLDPTSCTLYVTDSTAMHLLQLGP